MNTSEDTQSRKSIVTDTLQSLTDQTKQWRAKIDLLEAGQKLDRAEALADLNQLLDVCQNLRDAILSEDTTATWHTKEELHTVVSRLDDAAARRQRYLDLAQWLSAGTVTHRRERTRQERLRQRDAAVAELMEISAQSAPPDLPGPAPATWLEWACSLDDSTNDPDLATLKTSFPRVDDFVRQMEIELWQDGPANGSKPHAASSPAVTHGPEVNAPISLLEPEPHKTSSKGTANSGPSTSGTSLHSNESFYHSALETLALPVEEAPARAFLAPDALAAPLSPEAAVAVEVVTANKTSTVTDPGKVTFFDADEIENLARNLEESKSTPKKGRKVRSLLAISHWLVPRDQNPVLHAKCGVRELIGFSGTSDLNPVAPQDADREIKADDGLLLFTGGADLLRWSLAERSEKRYDEIASLRRWNPEQIRSWFGDLHKIELAEPQVHDMYKLTYGIPLLVGELHRRTIPMHEAPPTWLGYAIWMRIKMSFEGNMAALAKELREGTPAVKLTERELDLLKMIVLASDESTPATIASNLRENWHQFKHPEIKPLSAADEDSILILQGLGLIPMRHEVGLKPVHAILPVDQDDPIRQIVKHL